MPIQEHRSPMKRKDKNQHWKDHDQVQEDAEVHDVFKKQNPFQKSNWTLEPRESFLNHQQQKDYLVLDGMVKNQKIGKKHAFNKYDQFALYTIYFWVITGSNITPVIQFHEIFVTNNNYLLI